MGDAYYSLDADKSVLSLGSDRKAGLSTSAAGERLKDFGLNEIKRESSVKWFTIFLRQFKSFIIYILVFALIFSVVVREYIDAIVIGAILVINASFGFIQEYRAEKSIESLKKLSSTKARVIRNKEMIEIDAKFLVPGDIVALDEGDRVPADGRVIESYSLSCLESSLTGESNPSSKINSVITGMPVINDQKNMVFSGTLVTKGRGTFVVTTTGMKTELGKIAHLLSEVEKEVTPLQNKLNKFGKSVGYGVILIAVLLFFIGAIRENLFSELFSGDYSGFLVHSREWILVAIALAVAAVPEGLPAVVTISLAIGVRRMLKKRSLIRRLPSVETLGETNVICCDKTGTLTKNEMTVRNLFINNKDYTVSGDGYSANGMISLYGKPFTEKDNLILKIGALCNNAELHISQSDVSITGDPTEAALLVSAAKAGLDYKMLREKYPKAHELPFDSERKMMSTIHQDGKEFVLYNKGAPERVLDKCSHILYRGRILRLSPEIKKRIIEQNKLYANLALRVLGFAYKKIKSLKEATEDGFIFVGLQGMIDPPKNEIKEYVVNSKKAGIRVIMITGDNINTAAAVAREIGLSGESIDGTHFATLGDIEKKKIILNTNIFARVEPSHKLEIIRLLQESEYVVAMTGDGVNDAPALKRADIGVAMGIRGTDVSKEASDMVLTDDNFSTIVSAVEEGRGIYTNILSFVKYLISSNLAEVLVVAIAILFGLPLPLTALMLLWINLVTDGLPALALSVDPYPKGLMERPPRQKNEPLMTKGRAFSVVYVSVLIAAGVLATFIWGLNTYGDEVRSQTIAFTSIVIFELVRIYSVRAEAKIPAFSNPWLIGAVLASFGLQLLVIYTPLSHAFGTVALTLNDWASIAISAFVVFVLSLVYLAFQKNR